MGKAKESGRKITPGEFAENITRTDFILHADPAFKTDGFSFKDLKKWRYRITSAFIRHNLLEILKWEIRKPMLLNPKIFWKRLKTLSWFPQSFFRPDTEGIPDSQGTPVWQKPQP